LKWNEGYAANVAVGRLGLLGWGWQHFFKFCIENEKLFFYFATFS